MPTMDPVAQLALRLRTAASFEDAAERTLEPMLELVQHAITAAPHCGGGTLVRGALHLRPVDAYQRLLVLERGDGGAGYRRGNSLGAQATTAWRWVEHHKAAVWVDVAIDRVTPHGATAPQRAFETQQSGVRFATRGVTHVQVVPLRAPDRSIVGMASFELDLRNGTGKQLAPLDWVDWLELLADVATPHLAALPSAPPPVATDALLPVVGTSMAPLIAMLRVFAGQDDTILIGGPTGAGKSRLARWCHEQSARRGKPFGSIDLNTVPEELQFGELFGWKRGAFTGAVGDHPGALASAQGGTLFIDEIDKLSLATQAGLLRVMEERLYRTLGEGARDRVADVRFIVGSNANLQALVAEGRFRPDLYYRINVLPVRVPSLGERRDEIAAWARFMLARRHADTSTKGSCTLAEDAAQLLTAQPWPGNLRQLDNILRRAYSLALMVTTAGGSGNLTLTRREIAQALAYESPSAPNAGGAAGQPPLTSLADALAAAARAVVTVAERRGGLDLDLCDGLRGMVLATAAENHGREEAFRLLGKEALVKGRNHHKAWKREIARATELCAASGDPAPAILVNAAKSDA